MAAPHLTTSVIICTYTEKRWDYLVSTIDSLQRQTIPATEVLVVVDHNPTLLKKIEAHFSDNVTAIENRHLRGASGARNSGIAVAKGEIIAFLDDDVITAPDWVEQMLISYQEADVIGVGGMITPLWQSGQPTWFPEEFNWVVGCSYRGMPETVAPIRNLIGCNMSLRREVFEAVGGFRDGFGRIGSNPVACGETELCIRIQQHCPEKIFLHQPAMKVQHQVPSQRATWRYFCDRCYSEGISKGLLAQLVGSQDGLASEWHYTLHTLPRGIMQGVADTVLHRDFSGLKRAAAITLGFAMTTVGYVRIKALPPKRAISPHHVPQMAQ